MNIQLSDHFDYKRLLRFTFPSVVMLIFTSIYGVVDGFFVSNFVGKTPFASVNFIMPFIMVLGGLGFMFGTGGGALVAKTMGEGKKEKANEIFSFLVYVAAAVGLVLTVFSIWGLRRIACWMGAEGGMLENCVIYGRILLYSLPFLILQFALQSFFVVAERPQMGLINTVVAGVVNIGLDALFMAVFHWGIRGAAWATTISQMIGGLIPVLYFYRKSGGNLRLTRMVPDWRALKQTCWNGSSELMSNVSMSLVGILYNVQLLHYAGENGVAAYGVIMYVNLIFLSVFIGYSTGMAPILSYHYGAGNQEEMRNLRKKSLRIIGVSSLGMLALAQLLAETMAGIFVGYDGELMALTVHAFRIHGISFLFAGLAIYGSSFFTALNNGLLSALISFLRTLVFQMGAVLLLPVIWGAEGIWFAVVVAEFVAAVLTAGMMAAKKAHYQY